MTEFYAPFAHVPGRIEWCRIHSPTHGSFDSCIILGESTAHPAVVYVNDDRGVAFMQDRFPECMTHRVAKRALRLQSAQDGLRLHCHLSAHAGPVRRIEMAFVARPGVPKENAYGGQGKPVWGSRFTCTGVDLELPATVHGVVHWEDEAEPLTGMDAVLTVGSFGVLEEL